MLSFSYTVKSCQRTANVSVSDIPCQGKLNKMKTLLSGFAYFFFFFFGVPTHLILHPVCEVAGCGEPASCEMICRSQFSLLGHNEIAVLLIQLHSFSPPFPNFSFSFFFFLRGVGVDWASSSLPSSPWKTCGSSHHLHPHRCRRCGVFLFLFFNVSRDRCSSASRLSASRTDADGSLRRTSGYAGLGMCCSPDICQVACRVAPRLGFFFFPANSL